MIAAILARLLPWLRFWPLALALAAFAAGWKVEHLRWQAAEAEALQQQEQVRQEEAKLAAQAEALRAKIEKENRELTRRLSHETRQNAYRCPLPAAGLGLLNAARAGQPASQPVGSVP